MKILLLKLIEMQWNSFICKINRIDYIFLFGFILFFSPRLSAGQLIQGTISAPSRVTKTIVYLKPGLEIRQSNKTDQHFVSQKNAFFMPPVTIINQGDQVIWINDENKEIDHNIYSLSPLNRFDLGLGEAGSRLGQHFHKTGMLNYYCSVHKTMEGQLVILPSKYFFYSEHPSNFSIQANDIPNGQWELNAIVFHKRYKAVPIKINIGQDQTESLNLEIIRR